MEVIFEEVEFIHLESGEGPSCHPFDIRVESDVVPRPEVIDGVVELFTHMDTFSLEETTAQIKGNVD